MNPAELSAALNYPARVCTEIGYGLKLLFGKKIGIPAVDDLPYIYRIDREVDVFFNVIFLMGLLQQTVSLHAALMWQAYEEHKSANRLGCWLCAYLDKCVQVDHCKLMLLPNCPPMPSTVYWKAGIGFAVASVIMLTFGYGAYWLFDYIWKLI